MGPKKWIDKNTATTYMVVHRPQNDPLIHDTTASPMVFQEVDAPQAAKKGLSTRSATLSQLDSDLRSHASASEFSIRDNEGEAAEYGVYYDDTEYDYMQHMRDLGSGEGQGFFVEAAPVTVKGKGKGKEKGVSLDEALKALDLEHEKEQQAKAGKLVDESILPSKNLKRVTYQDQQDIPDALKGFQPDMDWRLREALEALEDEEFVDNDDQDLFDQLANDAEEIDDYEFEEAGYGFEDEDGWESDRTAKPDEAHGNEDEPLPPSTLSAEVGELPPSDAAPPDAPSDPLAAFNAHRKQAKSSATAQPTPSTASAMRDRRMHDGAAASTVLTGASFMSGRHKKRKGALTNPSSFSMTSSALARTEGQTLLDQRFDRVMETQYEEDELAYEGEDDGTASVATGGESMVSGVSGVSGVSMTSSKAPDLVRADYSGVMDVMDDFLGGFGGGPAQEGDGKTVKRRGGKVRRGYGGQSGMEQLDEIRKELGRPRIAGIRT